MYTLVFSQLLVYITTSISLHGRHKSVAKDPNMFISTF